MERRGALLRDPIHRIDAQLKWEGIDISFNIRVGEAAFAGDALLTVNITTPYNAVYGRVPHLLPNIHALEDKSTTNKSMPGLIRDSHRLRDIRVQSMIEGTAKSRLGRALNTRTLPAGER